MDLLILKIISLFTILLVTLACSFLPIFLLKRVKASLNEGHKTIISLCNCFGGGVFLAMCFMGLLPYAEERFALLGFGGMFKGFPFAQFIAVLGFLLTLSIEVFVQENHGHSHEPENYAIMYSELNGNSDEEMSNSLNASGQQKDGNWTINSGNTEEEDLFPHGDHHETHAHDFGEMFDKEKGMRLVVLIVAVSIHSLFEGLALGLLSDKNQVIQMLVAILIHESIIAVALGIRIGQQNRTCCVTVRNVLIFTLTIPIGILIGIGLEDLSGRTHNIVSGILQGLAAGVFLHVTFFEIIPTELKTRSHKLLKLVLILFGVLTLMVLKIILND